MLRFHARWFRRDRGYLALGTVQENQGKFGLSVLMEIGDLAFEPSALEAARGEVGIGVEDECD